MRRGLLLGTGAAIAAAFGGPMAAMAKRVEYRGDCAAGPASPSVESPYGPTAPVRNHEQSTSTNAAAIVGALSTRVAKYDTGTTAGNFQTGGTTNLVWRNGEWVGSYASLGGIYRPCAGGASTWGSWLSNEELRSNAVSST